MNLKAGAIKNTIQKFPVSVFLWCFFFVFVIVPVFFVLSSIHISDFSQLFSTTTFFSALKNTAVECVCSTFLSVAVGYVYAYAVVRGNIPLRHLFALLPVVHMITPPFVGGLSFILLFGRQGFITKSILGLDVSLYGFWGLLISQTLCFFPIAYLMCAQSIKGINPSYEQSAKSMGSGKWKIFKTITFPLSFAGISSSFLFIAVSVLSDFGNPLIVGGRFKVLSVEIYTQLTGWLNSGVSAVLGLMLLVPSIFLFILQYNLLKKNSQKIATVGEKTFAKSDIGVSKTVSVLLTVFCSVISLIILAQVLSIVAGAFQKLWGINKSFTLNHIKSVLKFKHELVNSIRFAFFASVLATIIASVTAYLNQRSSDKLTRGLDAVCQLPAAIPGSLFGLAFLYTSNFFHINWSSFLIIMVMTVSYIPFSYRICSASFSKLKISLDEAAYSLGSSKIKVLADIIFPLSTGGLFSSFTYVFARGVGTLSSVIFLTGFNTGLSSVKIMNLAEQGDWGKSAALALVLTLFTFIIVGAGNFVSRKFSPKIYEQ